MQKNEQQRVVRDCGKSGLAEQFALAELFRPSRHLPAQGFIELRQKRRERSTNSGILLEELRHQRERVRVENRSVLRLALRVKNAREIVVRLRVIGIESTDAFVAARCIVKLASAFERQRIQKHFVDLTARGLGGARVRRAMLKRGAALFPVHRP